jgi:predicted Zn-dependent protease
MKPYLASVLGTLAQLRSYQGDAAGAAQARAEAGTLSAELAEAVANLDLRLDTAVAV